MSDNKRQPYRLGGVGWVFFFILFVLKVGVGDTTVQDWSWWWVTAPLWGPLSVALVFLALGKGAQVIANKLETPEEKAARLLREYGKTLRH